MRETYPPAVPGEAAPRPDFVIVGGPARGGGVELWASTELSHAELEALIPRPDLTDLLTEPLELRPVRPVTYTLTAGLARYVLVRAPDYRAALEALTADPGWDPGSAGGGPLAIGPP